MKTLPLFTLIFLTNICIGQTNYYYQNDGKDLKTRAEVWVEYEHASSLNKRIMTGGDSSQKIVTEPIIYHQEFKGDSIINYYSIISYYVENEKAAVSDFVFTQDSIFLYLNKKLPDFKLIDVNGNDFSLDQIEIKPTLINFTAIYCKPCLEEIPRLNQLKRLYQDKLNFIAIFDVERNPGDVEKTMVKHPFDFHILRNTQEFKNQINIKYLPYNIFIDKDGYVRYIQKGYYYFDGVSDNNYFTRIIDELLKIR